MRKKVCVWEISPSWMLKSLIIFIFKVYFLVKFDYLIIYIDIIQHFIIFYRHSLTQLSKSELATSPLIAKIYTKLLSCSKKSWLVIANQWNPFPCCVLVQAAMAWLVIFKWTLFSYRNPVYLYLWLWSIYITCVFCLYLLLFIFLLI